jgi:hypothetical protein
VTNKLWNKIVEVLGELPDGTYTTLGTYPSASEGMEPYVDQKISWATITEKRADFER